MSRGVAISAVFFLVACAEPRPIGPAPDTIIRGEASRVVLKGSALFDTSAPPPRGPAVKLEPGMAKIAGGPELIDETWRVDRLSGVADVLVLALPRDARFVSAPAKKNLILGLSGPRFDRRVLAATPGSELRLENRVGPDAQLKLTALSGPAESSPALELRVPAGKTITVPMEAPGVFRLADPSRPYLRAFIVVATTPYTAVTSSSGAFQLILAPGFYTLRTWHEASGWAEESSRELSLEREEQLSVAYQLENGRVTARIQDPKAGAAREPEGEPEKD